MNAEYIGHLGDDLSVVNDARVSFSKKSDWIYSGVDTNGPAEKALSNDDVRLIQYLARGCSAKDWGDLVYNIYDAGQDHDFGRIECIVNDLQNMHTHWTPFAHQTIKLRMKAPVPIRTQCFKHKMGFVENEESRRYIKSTPELFVPDHFREAAKNVKQGSGKTHQRSFVWKEEYERQCWNSILMYEEMIEDGVCPEQARFVLPQGVMVNWIWTGNLASFARFYNQRTDPHAQKEIQDLALAVGEIIAPLYPVSWSALTS